MILELEERAFRAWPAEEVHVVDGWRLRATRGVTRRANSVWVSGGEGTRPLADRLDRVEAFYAARGLPTLYQVTALAPGLDEALAARGYTVEAPVAVEIAALPDRVISARPDVELSVDQHLTPAWFDISARRGRFADVADVYRGLLDRLQGCALFALAQIDGAPAAVGLGVVDGDWLGVFSMLTVPEHRRRGLASAVLDGLVGAARTRGVGHLYLQVELENEAARAFYGRRGFREAYRYHYRRAPRPAG